MKPFRILMPTRTCTKSYNNYRKYKKHLREDFNKRCGYCNDIDFLCGGERGFHIDHFRPKSIFPHLENYYGNLVYACPYCNGAKLADWPSEDENIPVLDDGRGYLDPCDSDFEDHFERYNHGVIRPRTVTGAYMYKKLNLGLIRHQIAWLMEQLEERLNELSAEIENADLDDVDQNHVLWQLKRAMDEYLKYKRMFEENI